MSGNCKSRLFNGCACSRELLVEVRVDEAGDLCVQFAGGDVDACYIVDERRLQEWFAAKKADDSSRVLIEMIGAINNRAGVLTSLIRTVCFKQMSFIASGDVLDLRPLSQAELARELGCNRSVVSRISRDVLVQISHGRYALDELMPRRQQIVGRLAKAHPNWSDTQIAVYMQHTLGVRLSRRTVNYHRNSQAGAS